MRKLLLALVVLALCAAGAAQTPVNIQNIGGSAVATGNGTAAGSLRVSIASDSTGQVTLAAGASTIVTQSTASNLKALVNIQGNGGATLDVAQGGGTAATNAVQIAGVFNTSFPTLTNGQGGAIQLDSSGRVFVNCATGCSASSTIQLIPGTSGGLTVAHTLAAASNNATSLKASAGQVYSYCVNNNTTYPLYLKFYNKATAPAPASDTPVIVFETQAGVPLCRGTEQGYVFGTGIAWALVKGISDTDNTSVLASDGTVEIAYK